MAKLAVELKPGVGVASFMAGDNAVELDEKNSRYECADANEHFRLLRDHPFLQDAKSKAVSNAG
jgi:hypothetical protein